MNHTDFVHEVRLNERASAADSVRYRRGVAAFAALGHGGAFACVVFALGLLVWTLGSLGDGELSASVGLLLLFGVGLVLWFALGWLSAALRALWVRRVPPAGVRLERADAPLLFESIDRIRRKIDGPPVHRIYLDAEFGARISQRPRFGLFGGTVNTLSIGLPLLMALERRRLLSVLAHEYGHLRGNQGRVNAWVYGLRESWLRLDASLRRDEGVVALALRAFVRWYFPRFSARTFALARQEKYKADRVSASLLGNSVAAAALTEIEVKRGWYAERFWGPHWARAADTAQPVGPFGKLQARLRKAPSEAFAQQVLRRAIRGSAGTGDTHPALRDRLEALEQPAQMPEWSSCSSFELLADAPRWIEHFDRQWCEEHARAWAQHHAYLARVRERVGALAASANRNTADEMVECAVLQRRLNPAASVRASYERALQLEPDHARALRGLAQALQGAMHGERLALLESLYCAGELHGCWAATQAVTLLEAAEGETRDHAALRIWRTRLKLTGESQARLREKMGRAPLFSEVARHDLGELDLAELRADLMLCRPVSRAWVVRKALRESAACPAYLVLLELPTLADHERRSLCRQLEQTLLLPGTALVLCAGQSPTRKEIERAAFEPIWERAIG